MTTAITKVPKLDEIYGELESVKKHNELNVILNAEPKQEWIKIHPFIKDHQYIPIERIEFLLTAIFVRWWVEVLNTKLTANSIEVTVRLFVINPLGSEVWHNDGVGAFPLQTY